MILSDHVWVQRMHNPSEWIRRLLNRVLRVQHHRANGLRIEKFVHIAPVIGCDDLVLGQNALIRSHSVIYAGSIIGENFVTGHGVLIRQNCAIGANVSIGSKTVIEHNVNIGNNSRLHSQCFVPEFSRIGHYCWIGPNVVLTNSRYPARPKSKDELDPVVLEDGVVVGANSTILPGIKIGSGAIIGAGSVVTRDVASGMVVAGNPARVINHRRELNYD